MHEYRTIEDLINEPFDEIYNIIEYLSLRIELSEDLEWSLNMLLKICLNNDTIDMFERQFLLWQCIRLSFANPQYCNAKLEIVKAWMRSVNDFEHGINYNFTYLQKENRNKNRAVVIVPQIFTITHSPTLAALAICDSLVCEMGMEVLLINTAELCSNIYSKPYHNPSIANYLEDLYNIERLDTGKCIIDFMQCSKYMPNKDELICVFDKIAEYKPNFIISLGTNMTAELCSNIVPVLSVPTLVGKLPVSQSQFLMLRKRKLEDKDSELLSILGKSKENVIDNTETSIRLLEQQIKLSRRDLDLPEGRPLVAISGNRLDSDINHDVIEFLRSISDFGVQIVLIGDYNKIDDLFHVAPELRGMISYIGNQSDYQAAIELCDLMLNPDRQGNGMIGLLTMLKGVPIITFPNNDLASLLPQEFYVETYVQMKDTLYKYFTDMEYYQSMCNKVYDYGQIYLKECTITHAINQMLESSLFV